MGKVRKVQPLLALVNFVMPVPVNAALSSAIYEVIMPELSRQGFSSRFQCLGLSSGNLDDETKADGRAERCRVDCLMASL